MIVNHRLFFFKDIYMKLKKDGTPRKPLERRKKFTKEQLKEAIDNSDYTAQSVADYIAQFICRSGTCTVATVQRYLKEYDLEAYFRYKIQDVSKKALHTIRDAIEDGDVKTARWWLSHIQSSRFGDKIVLETDKKDPLNINIAGELLTRHDLEQANTVTLKDAIEDVVK